MRKLQGQQTGQNFEHSSFAFQGRLPRVMWKTQREAQVMEIQGILGETGNTVSICPARPLNFRGHGASNTPLEAGDDSGVLLPATA